MQHYEQGGHQIFSVVTSTIHNDIYSCPRFVEVLSALEYREISYISLWPWVEKIKVDTINIHTCIEHQKIASICALLEQTSVSEPWIDRKHHDVLRMYCQRKGNGTLSTTTF